MLQTSPLTWRGSRILTYMSLVVELVVGELELVEAHHLPHPRLARGRRVRVDVDPGRHGGVRVARDHPLGAVIHVPARLTKGGGEKKTRNKPKNMFF